MLDRDVVVSLDSVAADLLRIMEERKAAGDREGMLVASDAADALLVLLDLDALRLRAGRSQ